MTKSMRNMGGEKSGSDEEVKKIIIEKISSRVDATPYDKMLMIMIIVPIVLIIVLNWSGFDRRNLG